MSPSVKEKYKLEMLLQKLMENLIHQRRVKYFRQIIYYTFVNTFVIYTY